MYDLIEDTFRFFDYNEDLIGVELLIDNYEGVKYCYDRVSVDVVDENLRLKFTYYIIDKLDFEDGVLEKDSRFLSIISDILYNHIYNEVVGGEN